MASIHRRSRAAKDGKAQYSYIVMWDDPSGAPKSKTFRLQKDAKVFKAEIERSLNRGTYIDPHAGKIPFREYAATWLAGKEVSKRDSTVKAYRNALDSRILPTLGDLPLHTVQRSQVQDLVNALNASHEPRTVRHTYTIVAGIFRRAVTDDLIGRSPCRSIELPPVKDDEFVPLTAEQVNTLADAIEPRYRAMVITAVGTGMRWSELAGLTVDRVDFLRRTLRVDRQLKRDSTELVPPKTAKSVRTLPLPQYVIDALAVHIAKYGAGPDGHVFSTSRKTVLRYTNFRRRVWDAAIEKAEDIPADTTFHDLRHAYASLLISAGLSPKIIQVRMGHDSITTTMDTYGHLYPESEDATRAAIDEVFRPEVDEKLTGRSLKLAA